MVSTMLYSAHSFYSHMVVLINMTYMPFSINKQVQPLQCDKEIILAGTFQGYIIRGDRINKPALVRRKHGDVISFLVIILLYSPKKTPWDTGALKAGGNLTVSLHVNCAAKGLLRDPPEWQIWQVTLRHYMKRDPGTELCLVETCRHLEMLCRESWTTTQCSFILVISRQLLNVIR